MNWRSSAAGGPTVFSWSCLTGHIWLENAGWVSLNAAPPSPLTLQHANTSGADFGVNLDHATGLLSGFAWGENIDWINFSGGGQASPANPARLDFAAMRLRGYAWAPNVGWINLDDANAFVKLDCSSALPTFAQNPVSALTCPSGSVIYQAVPATTAGPFNPLQWQRLTHLAPPPAPPEWVDLPTSSDGSPASLPGGTVVSGARSTRLSLSSIAAGDLEDFNDGRGATMRVRCHLVTVCGAADSAPARLSVCRADANCDNAITPADVAHFVDTWFTSLQVGSLAGDFDGDGLVRPADIAGFVNAWFRAVSTGQC